MSRLEKIDYPFLNQEIYYRHMNNGMKVYYLPKKDFQEQTAILTVDLGSIDKKFTINGVEREFPAGIAHFLEHQLFEGSEGQDVGNEFTLKGSESNAYTTFDKTSYFFSTVESFENSLDMLLEFTSSLHVSQKSIDKERESLSKKFPCIKMIPILDFIVEF